MYSLETTLLHFILETETQLSLGMVENPSLLWNFGTLSRILKPTKESSLRHVKIVHSLIIRNRFAASTYLSNRLIQMYSDSGSLTDAYRTFKTLQNKNIFSYNTLINAFTRAGDLEKACKLFDEMPERDDISWNTLIGGYAKNGNLGYARTLWDKMPKPNTVTWTTIISAYAQNGYGEESLHLFSEMSKRHIKIDEFTLSSVLCACLCPRHGIQLHAYVLKNGYSPNVFIASGIIGFYAKIGALKDAQQVFDEMPARNIVIWNALINGYTQNGLGKEAVALFEGLADSDVAANGGTFVGVLSACGHCGMVEEGVRLFREMSERHGVEPGLEHYACVVDLLGRAGRLEEAERVLLRMPFEADVPILGAFLSACNVHGHLSLAEWTAYTLFEKDPFSTGPFVTLSNMYASVGDWENVVRVRKLMYRKQPQT